MKIGSSPRRQYYFGEPPEFSVQPLQDGDSTRGWHRVGQSLTSSLTQDWFGIYTSAEYIDLKRSLSEGASEENFAFTDSSDPLQLESNFSRLGEPRPLDQSSLAQRIFTLFEKNGISGTALNSLAIGGMIIEIPVKMVWVGNWGTMFGTPVAISLEAFRDSDGSEKAFIGTNLVIATRMMDAKALEEMKLRLTAETLPHVFFLAETPFPSTPMSVSRELGMSGLPSDSFPSPAMTLETHAQAYASSVGRSEVASYPHVIRVGYAIKDLPDEDLYKALTVAIDSTVTMAGIVEDGFRNHREHFLEAFPPESPKSEYPFGGYARWLPEVKLAPLLAQQLDNLSLFFEGSGTPAQQRQALEWVVAQGIGAEVANTTNTLCYSHLFQELDFSKAEFLLRQAIALDSLNQSTNAMCNLGTLFIMQGRFSDAEETLKATLERADKFSEAEASYLLGNLYRARGDLIQSRSYYDRSIEARDEEFSPLAAEQLSRLT